MSASRRGCLLALLAAFASVPSSTAIGQPAAGPTPAEIVAAARTLVAAATFASLGTVDAAGQPRARIVEPFPPDEDFTIWVGTHARSAKVAEIAAAPHVSLLYFDRARPGYVTITGRAAIVRDARLKAAHWNPAWKGFYEDEHRGEDYVLLRVEAARLELSAPSLGMQNDPRTWKPVTLDLRPR